MGMVSGGQCGFDLEKLEEVSENLSSKLGAAVGDHLLWETKAFEEVVDKELCGLLCRDLFGAWDQNYPLCKPVVHHGQDRVVSVRFREVGNEVG